MNEIMIREAEIEDAKSIQQINLSALGYKFDIESTTSQLISVLNSRSGKIFVAVVESDVVGYIHANDYICTYASSVKDIIGLAVLSEYQKLGIGRKLLEKLEEWAKADGSDGVRLVSGIDRQDSHEFYLRCGYESRKDQKNFLKLFNEL